MAEIVGSALLSAFFSVLFDKLATEEVKNFLRPKKVINKLLEKLKVSLLSANKLLDVAEEKQIEDETVEKWLNELKDVVYKASELGDKIETEALRRNLEGHQSASNITKMFTKLCSNLLISFDNYVKVELEEILSSLEHLLSQKDALGLVPAGTGRSNYSGVTPAVRFRATPLADESGFCGREDIKKTIIQSLQSGEVGGGKVSVIPVIGAGGIGKTTLVQIIYDLPQVKLLFGEVRAWITVSTEFDLTAIIKKIIGQVSDSSQIDGIVDQQLLLFKLRDALKGKRFLIVLDDVWSEDRDEWDNLKSCFESGERGSKIIVTTRSTRVASIAAPNQPLHLLQELPEEDCWRLFEKIVFTSDQDREARPDLQEIGKKIVKKCKGLPLSVKSVGGILRDDRDLEKWESILKSSVWELLQKNNKNIVPSLWLSYRYLPSDLKRCFAYCSIFPKDYRFKEGEVVQLWMAEGFLENVAGSTMEEVGMQYFEDLKARSLFQRCYGGSFIMHDLVHDLAMYVSGKFCFWMDEDKILHDLPCETRHLSYNLATKDAKQFPVLSKAKRLHSFVGLLPSTRFVYKNDLNILKVLEEVSVEGACLRVLSLSSLSYKIDSLPDSVGKLKHLRYLNLSYTAVRELPHYVGTFYNLQTLLLSRCKNLTQLPESIGNLKQLRYLDLSYTAVRELPHYVGTLQNLQTLLLSSCENLTQLPESIGNLKHLRYLNLSETSVTKLPDSVGTLYNLQTLVLAHCINLTQLPESIGNLKQLRCLDLSYSNVRGLPNSIVTLYNLRILFLLACRSLTRLPSNQGSLINLHHLDISNLPKLEFLGNCRYGSLKDLKIKKCEALKSIPMDCFPKLNKLDLKELKCLVELTGELSNELKWLSIEECPKLEFTGNGRYGSLEDLKIKKCETLKSIPLDYFPKLNTLDLKELEYLVELTGNWPDELEGLSIEKCPKLEFLGNCSCGSLKEWKTEECEALKSIPLDYFPKLNRFTLWKCENFESLRFAEEPPLVLESLTYLELYNLPKFVSFPEGGLPAPNLKDFRIEECENLRSLPQQMRRLLPSLNHLRVFNCGEIESWPEGGLPSNLESLRIWGCKKLGAQVMHWDLQTVTRCLKELDIDGCGEELLDSFPPEGLLPTSLTSLSIHNFRRLKTINIHAFQHLKKLYVFGCDDLQCLPEESLPKSLSSLEIYSCPLLGRRYRKETGEGWHKISHIPNVEIFP